MDLHFSMFFQRGTGAVAGVYEDAARTVGARNTLSAKSPFLGATERLL